MAFHDSCKLKFNTALEANNNRNICYVFIVLSHCILITSAYTLSFDCAVCYQRLLCDLLIYLRNCHQLQVGHNWESVK